MNDVFVRAVKARMAALNINQAELARRLRVPPSNVSHYLSGHRTPGVDLVQRYATALETLPSDLMRGPTDLPVREPTPEEMLARIVSRMGIDPERERIIQKALAADAELLLKFRNCLKESA